MNDENEVAVKVAERLGFTVVGEAVCENEPECGNLEVNYFTQEIKNKHRQKMWPVYVRSCCCEFEESKKDIQLFGHSVFCLAPVPNPHVAHILITMLKELEYKHGWRELAKMFQNCRHQGEMPVEDVIIKSFIAEENNDDDK